MWEICTSPCELSGKETMAPNGLSLTTFPSYIEPILISIFSDIITTPMSAHYFQFPAWIGLRRFSASVWKTLLAISHDLLMQQEQTAHSHISPGICFMLASKSVKKIYIFSLAALSESAIRFAGWRIPVVGPCPKGQANQSSHLKCISKGLASKYAIRGASPYVAEGP
jgi:hypothetical protein